LKINCQKDVWVPIISNVGKAYPQNFKVNFETSSGKAISGVYREQRYLARYPQEPIEGKLLNSMKFKRNWSNGVYNVQIKTDENAVVDVRAGWTGLILAFLITFMFTLALSGVIFSWVKESSPYKKAFVALQNESKVSYRFLFRDRPQTA
jgi:hypothetical protein